MTHRSFEWHPAKLLIDEFTFHNFALLVLNQPLRNSTALRRLWKKSLVRVAADGGANRLHELSSFRGKFSNLQAIVGDLDSLTPSVRDFYTCQPTPAEVFLDAGGESTDFFKAAQWIRRKYPGTLDIVVLGGLGGRIDQGLSQLHHLYLLQPGPDYDLGRIFFLSTSNVTILLKPGVHHIHVLEEGEEPVFGKHVGIVPLQGPSILSTKGLQWDVKDWKTSIGGQISTSNHILPETKCLEIETSETVLFTIALRQAEWEEFS